MTNSEKKSNNQPTGRGDPPHNTDNDMEKMKLTVHRCSHFRDWQDVMLEGVNIKSMLDRVSEEIVKERAKTATLWKR